jgi:ferrochelatase
MKPIHSSPIGILLLAFGGPSSLDEVESFLKNLLGKQVIPSNQLKKIKSRYQLIGGGSPLLDITLKQARALEKRLQDSGRNFRVYAAMRYWHPSIEDVMKKIYQEGICRIIAISLTPHSSPITTDSYLKELKRVSSLWNQKMQISTIEDWHEHPLFLEALLEKIEEGLERSGKEKRSDIPVVFSAHSLPKELGFDSSLYEEKIKATIRGIFEKMEPMPWQLAFQSKGGGNEEWLEPEIESIIKQLSQKGYREAMVVPISFVSDHLETLYDLDIALRDLAISWDMALYRSPCLNDSPAFIRTLASMVIEHLEKDEK